MASHTKCSACGSTQVIPEVKILDTDQAGQKNNLELEVQAKPNARVFKKGKKGVLKAAVCGECGHVSLSIDNARELWQIYEQSQRT
jgi:formate dehydrogenase assembly factor FdhD